VVIVGKGGHAADIAWTASRCGIVVDQIEAHTPGELVSALNGRAYVLGMNDSHTRKNLDLLTERASRVLDPTLTGWPLVTEAGVVISANVTIGPKVTLGRHTHINSGVFVTRAMIGDYVTIGPGATICGDVSIYDEAMIGAGAVISNLCTIGEGAKIGAGAVVPPNTHVPPYETWDGDPARPVR
jgi:bifunctional N-acetylglucosamine-1-phosphate-uridyltransferase/glucosamine-1-phosphate-acetyltransferase GlmU-like protein